MNKLREARLSAMLTQKELAKKSGVSVRTILEVEKGSNCQMFTKRKLLFGLGLPFERRHEIFPELAAVEVGDEGLS
jgi:DNA-binding XRE family transcriptional regulator